MTKGQGSDGCTSFNSEFAVAGKMAFCRRGSCDPRHPPRRDMIFGSLVLPCTIWAQNYECSSYGVHERRAAGRNVRHGADPLPCSSGRYMRAQAAPRPY